MTKLNIFKKEYQELLLEKKRIKLYGSLIDLLNFCVSWIKKKDVFLYTSKTILLLNTRILFLRVDILFFRRLYIIKVRVIVILDHHASYKLKIPKQCQLFLFHMHAMFLKKCWPQKIQSILLKCTFIIAVHRQHASCMLPGALNHMKLDF